jgi:pimeloyl-ACP methyl ester carboxylesterase
MEPWPTIQHLSKKIQLNNSNLDLFYYEDGQSHLENLILIHGLGDEADTWRHVILPLAQNFHVYAFDLPGFGRSDKPDRVYSPSFFLDVLNDFISSAGIENTVLMGNSLGAILAQGYALDHPDSVSGLILVDGALFEPNSKLPLSMKLMQMPLLGEWLYTRLRKDPDAAYASLRSFYHNLDGLSQEDRDFLYKRVNQRVWSDGQRRAYFSTLRNLTKWVRSSQEGLAAKLDERKIPTLVIRGEFDPLFTEANADALVKVQDNAIKITMPDAGHLPHQETPDAFLKAISLWIEKQIY